MTFLESRFPFAEVSALIQNDRRVRDPVYVIHRWWARRPPALMRAVLLAATLDRLTTTDEFWSLYSESEATQLEGLTVKDPFVGGGSTLIEAQRMGADVVGGDIDPLAVEITRFALSGGDSQLVRESIQPLLGVLRDEYEHLYPSQGQAKPLHYFYIREVTCPACGKPNALYRDKVIARSLGKHGSVVRDATVTCFCPDDWAVHQLADADALEFKCHGESIPIYEGTFEQQRFTCPHCGQRSTHTELNTGVRERRLIAVERLPKKGYRFIAPATGDEQALDRKAHEELVGSEHHLRIPSAQIQTSKSDVRPHSYGIEYFRDLFSARQLLVIGRAFAWVDQAELDQAVRTALRLGLSNALTTNNILCGYARDYGRLSPLFQVRGYALPTLSVELNPLLGAVGRGTLSSCLERVARSLDSDVVSRSTWNPNEVSTERVDFRFEGKGATEADVEVRNAEAPPADNSEIDLLVFDPPYFDYINYEDLSAFHRAWLDNAATKGLDSLFPKSDEVSSDGFGMRLGGAIANALQTRREGYPIAFTYHSADAEAWSAVAVALDEAKLAVTAAWPVKSDGHMGHHSQYEGACSWDIVLVCRPLDEVRRARCPLRASQLLEQMEPLGLGRGDRTNVALALDVIAERYGRAIDSEAT